MFWPPTAKLETLTKPPAPILSFQSLCSALTAPETNSNPNASSAFLVMSDPSKGGDSTTIGAEGYKRPRQQGGGGPSDRGQVAFGAPQLGLRRLLPVRGIAGERDRAQGRGHE